LSNTREYFFGASDLQMEAFGDISLFKRSLLQVLFHGELIIPDVFLYISNHLHHIVVSNDPIRSFLEESLRCGAIMPAFRSNEKNNFRDNLNEIRDLQIQGLHPAAGDICGFLEAAVRGRLQHYRTWPNEPISVGYLQTLERVFLSDPVTAKSAAFEKTWTRIGTMRRTILENVARDDLGGVRRGDLMNAMHLYVNNEKQVVNDVRTIWKDLQDQDAISDVKKFVKWFNYAYQYNQGRMFRVGPALGAMDEIDVEFSGHLCASSTEEQDGILWSDTFVIPSEEALLTVDPKFLFEIRNGQTGADYFKAVETWQREPSEESSNILLDRLRAYTAEICRLYIVKGRNLLNWEWHIKAHVPEDKIWNRAGLALARDVVGGLIPHFGLLSLIGPLGAATYAWWPASLARPLGIDNRIRLEIDAVTKRSQRTSDQLTDASFK
jgi:hypothetical protein